MVKVSRRLTPNKNALEYCSRAFLLGINMYHLQLTIYAQPTNPTIGENIKPYVRKYTFIN